MSQQIKIVSCEVTAYDTKYAVAVSAENAERAEKEMKKAYECWTQEDPESCILGYTANQIGQSCYGDFIDEWLRAISIPFNRKIGVVPLYCYCMDEAPKDVEDKEEWEENHETIYFVMENALSMALKNETVNNFLNRYTYDESYSMVMGGLEYIEKITV